MASFRITFNNTAGELDHRLIEVKDVEDGLVFIEFVGAISSMLAGGTPVHDGDSFTVEIEEDT